MKLTFKKITISITSIMAFCFTVNAETPWTLDLNFDVGDEGTQVTELTDAWGTRYEKNIFFGGGGSARMNTNQGATGFGSWGGIKNFPTALGEGDDLWIRLRTFFPENFNFNTNTGYLKFLRPRVREEDGTHLGNLDLMLSGTSTYRYQNELSTTEHLNLGSLRSASTDFVVGETLIGSVSGATAVVRAIKIAPESDPLQHDRVVFDYTNGSIFEGLEDVAGQTSGTTYQLKGNPRNSNSRTNFGTQYPVQTEVWETYVYRVRFSTTDPLIQFYKHDDETGFDADGKPIGGSLKLIFEDDTDYTLVNPTDQAVSLLIFTYWNGGAPQTQNMYVDDLWISTEPPPEIAGLDLIFKNSFE